MLAELFYVMYSIDNSLTPAGTTQFLRLHHDKNVVKAPNPSPDIAVPSRIPEGCLLMVILVTPLWNLRGLGGNSGPHFGSLRD